MADFTRFISYLYDYKDGERNRNLGFAKVESRQGRCRISICLNHGQVLQRELALYGYVGESDGVYLVRLGEMERGMRERRWSFPADRLGGKGPGLEELSGLILMSADRKTYLLSVWDDSVWKAEDICQGTFWENRYGPGIELYGTEDAYGGSESAGAEDAYGGNESAGAEDAYAGSESAETRNAYAGNEFAGVGNAYAGNEPAGAGNAYGGGESAGADNKRSQETAKRPEMADQTALDSLAAAEKFGDVQAQGSQEVNRQRAETENNVQDRTQQSARYQEGIGSRTQQPARNRNEARNQPQGHTRYQIDADNDRIAQNAAVRQKQQTLPALPKESAHAAPEEWRKLCRLFPAARPFEPSAWEVLCISLQDIGRLPPENWVWGSNHFLLHGFYQYHHLILARQRNENRIYLGVPGEFGMNEKFMAAMFGLHQFQRERQGKSDKGYWLTPIRL